MNLENRFEIGVCTTNVKPLIAYKKYLDSIFIGLPIIGNCRSNYITLDYLEQFITDCEDVPIWVTANTPVVDPKDIERICANLISAYNIFKFHGYIASDIIILKTLQKQGIPVNVSAVSDIRDLHDVEMYQNIGIKNIVLSYKANRNLDFINECIKYFPDIKFTIILNELCESNCPYRFEHFVLTSENIKPSFICPIRRPNNSNRWKLSVLQNTFIPPENLKHYPENVVFKLPTRHITFGIFDIIEMLEKYIGIREYKNILEFFSHHIDIQRLEPFIINKAIYDKWLNCKNQCYKCNICKSALDKME